MDELLNKINIRLRRFKPIIRGGANYTTWRENKVLQVTYKSRGCRNSALGSCLMCDYGTGRNLSLEETEHILPEVLMAESNAIIEELILNTYGSFLDEYEIPKENRRIILKQVAETEIPYITFETHYRTVTKECIEEIHKIIGDRDIAYEMGLESIDSHVLRDCLNKDINLEELKECIQLIHSYHHAVIFNILYGSPFLSEKQQMDDVLKSIQWAYEQGAEVIVLFPTNIKPFTALEYLYRGGFYRPVSHWGFIKLLEAIPEKILNRVSIAWYGNRVIKYTNYNFLPIIPASCKECNGEIMEFYKKFIEIRDARFRKELLKKIMNESFPCRCREEALLALENPEISEQFRLDALEYLKKTVLKDGKYAIPWKEY